jgi:hypothetical protein
MPPANLDGTTWISEHYMTSAPLPQGYPPPTPVNCIEIKTYPKEAIITHDSKNLWFPKILGLSRSFWPLFNHFDNLKIPMMSPVYL